MKTNIMHIIEDGKCTITSSFTQKSQFLKLIEILEMCKEKDLTVILNIKTSLEEFQRVFGLKCSENVGMSKINMPDIMGEGDDYLYIMIGRQIMDFYITNTYYVKSKSEKMVYVIKGVDDEN